MGFFDRGAQPSAITLADRAREAGDWETAARYYRTALARNPDNPPIWVQYGHALKESGRLAPAEAAYRRAIAALPAVADTHVQLGHVLKLQGRTDEARAAYLRALALDGGCEPARRELLAFGWGEDALEDVRRAAAAPNGRGGGAAAGGAADLARDLAEWEPAARLYREALERDPDNPLLWARYGEALCECGRHEEAEAAFRRALDYEPYAVDLHVRLGEALAAQRRIAEAEAAFLRAFALDPASSAALSGLLEVGWSRGRLAELCGLGAAAGGDTDRRLSALTKPPELPDEELDARVTAFRRGAGRSDALAELVGSGVEMPRLPPTEFAPDPRFIAAAYRGRATPGNARPGEATAPQYVSTEHLLHAHGLGPDLLTLFDFQYFFYANAAVRAALEKPDRDRCLLHFCACGIDALLPCADGFFFDAAFYRETYLDCRLGAANAYWHWLAVGLGKGWQPNRERWLKAALGNDRVTLAGFDFAPCVTHFYDHEKTAGWAELFGRFIDGDVLRPGPHLPVTEATADLFTAIADRFAASGREHDAAQIYQRILLTVPHHRAALLNYADSLMRQGHFAESKAIHEGLIARNQPSVWSFLHLATCSEALGDFRGALNALHAGAEKFPGEPQFKLRLDAAIAQFYDSECQRAMALGKAGHYQDAQTSLQCAGTFMADILRARRRLAPTPVRSVAIIVTRYVPRQCTFYRVAQKVEHLKAAGYAATVYDFESELSRFHAESSAHQAVIFYRVPATPSIIDAINRAKELGLVTFYDVDDFIFGAPGYPGSFESFMDLITIEDYVGLKLGVPLYRQAIALCDYAIASTSALADEMVELVSSGQAFVHRNALGRRQEQLAIEPTQARAAADRITIFYGSGTKSHKEDFRDLLEPALVEIVKRHGGRIRIVLVGYNVLSPGLEAIRDNLILIEPIADVEEYWALLKTADINVAVLKPDPMTDCKSEIKWLEAAMFGIPSVVSGTATYREVVDPGITGLVCDTVEEWTEALDRLVRDGELRRRIGLAAWRRARDAYGVERMAENLVSIFARTTPARVSVAKPKIVVVNVFYPPQAIGGATRIVYDQVEHLAQNYGDAFDIEVFTTGWAGAGAYELRGYVRDGIRVTAVSRPATPDIEQAAADEAMAGIFGAYLDRVAPTLVHFHCIQRLTASVVSAALVRRIPYFITAHDGWWISNVQFIVNEAGEAQLYDWSDLGATRRKYGETAYRRMMQLREPLFGAAKVLAVSEKFARLYRRCGVPNVVAVPNGIADLERKPRIPSPDGRVRLALLGGIGHAKGYYLIKYALLSRDFANLHLTVIDAGMGPGERRRDMWNTTPVEFVPKVEEEEVADLYATIDVLLAPSVCIESFGLVTREALHCGCWVVASDRGSIGDCIIEGQNGFVVDVSDASDLARVFGLIDREPQRYRGSPPPGPRLRRSSEQAEELAALYRSIMAGGRGASPPAALALVQS